MKDVKIKNNDSEQKFYVRLRVLGGGWERLLLPLTIGRSPLCDVLYNTEAMDDCSYVITERQDDLELIDWRNRVVKPMTLARKLGIDIVGPFPFVPGSGSVGTVTREHVLGMKMACKRLHRALWVRQSRLMRGLEVATGCFLILVCCLQFLTSSDQARSAGERSSDVHLEFQVPRRLVMGSAHHDRRFAKGFSISVDLPKEQLDVDLVLSFFAKFIEQPDEVIITIGDQAIFKSGLSDECNLAFCEIHAYLPKNLITQSNLIIEVQHSPASSDYVVRDFLLQRTLTPSFAEVELMKRRLDVVEGIYADRSLNYKNLVQAKLLSNRLVSQIKVYNDLPELQARAEVLAAEINKAHAELLDDLWFTVRKNIELAEYEKAIEQIQDLLVFYRDSSSQENQELQDMLKQIEAKK